MEKLEIKINDEYKVIPNEMTLSMYQQIMLNPELYDNNSLQVMSLYTGIPTNELKDLKSDEIQVIDYLISQRIKIKDTNELALTFIYNNVEYGLENDWSKLSWGAWMDFEVYSTENIYSNLHKIMAILYRPLIKKGTFNVKKYKIVPYKSEEIEDRAEIMKDVPLSYWLGAAQFFFFNRINVHKKYGGFFGVGEQSKSGDDEEMEETPKISAKEATARFYFNLTYQLAKEDVTKIDEVINSNLYICLNVASIMKDRYERERDEQRKLEQKYQSQRR